MGIGSSQLFPPSLFKTFFSSGFSAHWLLWVMVLGAGAPVQAQPKGGLPASDRINSSSPAAIEAKVLISEVSVVGLEDHPDKERLERAVYDSVQCDLAQALAAVLLRQILLLFMPLVGLAM